LAIVLNSPKPLVIPAPEAIVAVMVTAIRIVALPIVGPLIATKMIAKSAKIEKRGKNAKSVSDARIALDARSASDVRNASDVKNRQPEDWIVTAHRQPGLIGLTPVTTTINDAISPWFPMSRDVLTSTLGPGEGGGLNALNLLSR
jgi:hypothetical protein